MLFRYVFVNKDGEEFLKLDIMSDHVPSHDELSVHLEKLSLDKFTLDVTNGEGHLPNKYDIATEILDSALIKNLDDQEFPPCHESCRHAYDDNGYFGTVTGIKMNHIPLKIDYRPLKV